MKEIRAINNDNGMPKPPLAKISERKSKPSKVEGSHEKERKRGGRKKGGRTEPQEMRAASSSSSSSQIKERKAPKKGQNGALNTTNKSNLN